MISEYRNLAKPDEAIKQRDKKRVLYFMNYDL